MSKIVLHTDFCMCHHYLILLLCFSQSDAAQKKKDSFSSSLPENEFEGESDSRVSSFLPSFKWKSWIAQGSNKINFYDCDKDVDETERQCMLLDDHSFIYHTGHNFENQYLNA